MCKSEGADAAVWFSSADESGAGYGVDELSGGVSDGEVCEDLGVCFPGWVVGHPRPLFVARACWSGSFPSWGVSKAALKAACEDFPVVCGGLVPRYICW